MGEVATLIKMKYAAHEVNEMLYELMQHFTALDLVGIRDHLRGRH